MADADPSGNRSCNLATIDLVLLAATLARLQRPRARKLSWLVPGFVVAPLAAGILKVWLLAPVFMQLVHLLLADSVWISLVLLTAAALASEEATEAGDPSPHPARPHPRALPDREGTAGGAAGAA